MIQKELTKVELNLPCNTRTKATIYSVYC